MPLEPLTHERFTFDPQLPGALRVKCMRHDPEADSRRIVEWCNLAVLSILTANLRRFGNNRGPDRRRSDLLKSFELEGLTARLVRLQSSCRAQRVRPVKGAARGQFVRRPA